MKAILDSNNYHRSLYLLIKKQKTTLLSNQVTLIYSQDEQMGSCRPSKPSSSPISKKSAKKQVHSSNSESHPNDQVYKPQQPKVDHPNPPQRKVHQHKPSKLSQIFEEQLPSIIIKPKISTRYAKIDKFDCPVCLEDFNLGLNMPMMVCLSQHNVCEKCLNLFTDPFDCPNCRQQCKKTNIYRNRILQVFLKEEQFSDKESVTEIIRQETQKIPQILDQKDQQERAHEICRTMLQNKNQIEAYTNKNIMSYINLGENQLPDQILKQSFFDARKFMRDGIKIHVSGLFADRDNNPSLSFDGQTNQYKIVPSIELHQNLLMVHLDNNEIKEITGLSHLQSLKFLSLNNNQIKKIENLEGLKSLKFLYLNHNQIQFVENLIDIHSLLQVFLKHNKINKKNAINRSKIFQLKGHVLLQF